MKKYLVALVALSLSACGTPQVRPPAERKAEAERLFRNAEGCFLLYNMATKELEHTYNKDYCYERTAPASTFKVPLAVMAIDAGLIKDRDTPFAWDGKKREMPEWNRDQTAASWIKNSVVWVSQEITKKLGRKKVQGYLKKFSYGNRDFSGALDAAWLTPTPHDETPPRTSVRISPVEQLDFFEALWRDELPVSKHAQALARELTELATSHGFRLSGKTGSGYVGVDSNQRLGWFVGHVAGNGKEYLVATRFADREPPADGAEYGGKRAKEITLELLRAAGLW